MPKLTLKDLTIRNLKPAATLTDYSDEGCKGLHLRVTPMGVKTFTMIYRSRITGKVENITIGRYPEVSLADARERVLAAWKDAAASRPVAFTEAKKNGASVDDVIALYKQRKLSGLRSEYEIGINLTAVIERHKWGALPITSLTKAMIRDALYHIKEARKAPQSAGKTQRRFSTWLKWCVNEDYIPFNPIAGMSDISGGSKPRSRTLDDAEIRKLWKACENPGAYGLRTSYARAFQLLLATAARPGMVCGMPETELDLRNTRGPLWDVPAARMKMGKDFVCPLNPLAVAIIRRKDDPGPYICPTTSKFVKDKNRKPLHRSQLSFVAHGLCETLAIEPFTPHDLRRTASKLLRRAGYTRDQVGSLLAHEAEGHAVMRHYDPEDRWDGLDKKREMADRLAVILQGIVGDNVVKLREVA